MTANRRNGSVDCCRLLAAIGVVLVHLAPSSDRAEVLTRPFHAFAVPFFFVISLYFFISRVSALDAVSLRDLRLDRLCVPYAVWSAVYTSVQFVRISLGGTDHIIDTVGFIFFGGGAIHLYFLSLLVLFQAQALVLVLVYRSPANRLAAFAFAAGIMMIGYVGSSELYFGMEDGLKEGWLYSGLALILVWMQGGVLGRKINLAAGYVTVGLVIWLAPYGLWQSPFIGYGIAGLALNVRVPASSAAIKYITSCSYGIYLAHFAFLQGFQYAAQKIGHPLTPYTVPTKAATAVVICTCCLGFIWIARLHRVTAYLFLGESLKPRPPAQVVPVLPTRELPGADTAFNRASEQISILGSPLNCERTHP